jgi:hypothetical protein
MRVIKSEKYEEEPFMKTMINTIQQLEKKTLCMTCALRSKSLGTCPDEMYVACEYSDY